MQDFKKLMVWNKAHAFALDVYAVTKAFPGTERYGLTAQLRGSASSIATNIAEGCGRSTIGAFDAFIQVSAGSACEAEYQLLLARDLRYLHEQTHDSLSKDVADIQRMLSSLHRTLVIKAATRGRG